MAYYIEVKMVIWKKLRSFIAPEASTEKQLLFDNNLIHSHEINKYTTETNGQADSGRQQHCALYNSNTVAVNDVVNT